MAPKEKAKLVGSVEKANREEVCCQREAAREKHGGGPGRGQPGGPGPEPICKQSRGEFVTLDQGVRLERAKQEARGSIQQAYVAGGWLLARKRT